LRLGAGSDSGVAFLSAIFKQDADKERLLGNLQNQHPFVPNLIAQEKISFNNEFPNKSYP
jgi:hypothetical protein